MVERAEEIKILLLRNIGLFNEPRASSIADRFSLSRQAVYSHLRKMIAEGVVTHDGAGKTYNLPVLNEVNCEFQLSGLDEMDAWNQAAAPFLDGLRSEDRKICQYGFTEMVNNAVDHSEGRLLKIRIMRTAVSIAISIEDEGIGIFEKIAKALQLEDPRLSILELSKGKFTTDPSRHTGEGIFFTSRMFDIFVTRSKLLRFIHHGSWGEGKEDWLISEQNKVTPGTEFFMELFVPSTKTMESIFGQFHTPGDDFSFSRTHVPLALAQVGNDYLISRSQARRVLARFDRFVEVMLDFADVSTIGQGFADEIFRVFKKERPEVNVVWMNANAQVSRMIKRAQQNEGDKLTYFRDVYNAMPGAIAAAPVRLKMQNGDIVFPVELIESEDLEKDGFGVRCEDLTWRVRWNPITRHVEPFRGDIQLAGYNDVNNSPQTTAESIVKDIHRAKLMSMKPV